MAREQLETALLLNKGGGIYYDNARVDANEKEATLFIGLGGTGADMLIRIKNEVKRRMVLPQVQNRIVSDTPKNIGFLAVDSDDTSRTKAWGMATFDEFGAEYCPISVADKQAIVTKWKALAENDAEQARWYDKIDAVGALPGAGGIRQIGRLLLFENIINTRDRIKQKISELIAGGINKVNVFVVTGIAGGTGSGIFIDIAYLARNAMEDLAIPGRNVFGYIVLPDVNLLKGGDAGSFKRNGFAAFKEMDYWMSPGEAEHNDQFVQNYGGLSVRSIASPAFDFCHLLSAQDMNGLPLTYDKVIGSMAENVFAYIAGEISATTDSSGNSTMSSMYDNINGYITRLNAEAPVPACYRYLAVGCHKLEIPYEEISTLLAVRLFERLKPTLELRPTEETFKVDMRNLRLVPNEVIHESLTRDVPASPLDGKANYKYEQIWKDENNGPKSNRAYGDVHQWLAREFQVAVTKNVKNWANVQNGVFRSFIASNMVKPERGPQYLTALIQSGNEWSILPTLGRMAEHCDNVAATSASLRGQLENKLLKAYNAGVGKLINREKYVSDYITALREWKNNATAIDAYPQRAEAIRELRDKLKDYYDKVFIKLSDVLDDLPDIFSQNLKQMKAAQEEAEREGKTEETRLIWPLAFEAENRQEFTKMLDEGIALFLDDMAHSLSKWTGYDMDTLEATTKNDVPGFISAFISRHFGGLLNSINMEKIMRTKEGADNLDNYLHHKLLELKNKSVPMFSIRQMYRNTSTAEFGIASVPSDCIDIQSAAKNYLASDRIMLKTSKEKTRLYFVKVVSGIPLYAYSKIEEMESAYESAKTNETGRGMHIDNKWQDAMPTPLPEASWTPTVYVNPAVKKYNEAIRAAFGFCLENEVIRPDNPQNPTKYYLFEADPQRADAYQLHFSADMSVQEQLATLKEERDRKSVV
jgi:hypothetical protein